MIPPSTLAAAARVIEYAAARPVTLGAGLAPPPDDAAQEAAAAIHPTAVQRCDPRSS